MNLQQNCLPPAKVNGDMPEFNAESFKTKINAMVEGMLKQMPGIESLKDEIVRVNGIRINRVLVNGKDFFNGEPKMASRDLSADAVGKVQVFDKQSDLAAFTGLMMGIRKMALFFRAKRNYLSSNISTYYSPPP